MGDTIGPFLRVEGGRSVFHGERPSPRGRFFFHGDVLFSMGSVPLHGERPRIRAWGVSLSTVNVPVSAYLVSAF